MVYGWQILPTPKHLPNAIEKKRRKDLRTPQKETNRSRTIKERLPYPYLTLQCDAAGSRSGVWHLPLPTENLPFVHVMYDFAPPFLLPFLFPSCARFDPALRISSRRKKSVGPPRLRWMLSTSASTQIRDPRQKLVASMPCSTLPSRF